MGLCHRGLYLVAVTTAACAFNPTGVAVDAGGDDGAIDGPVADGGGPDAPGDGGSPDAPGDGGSPDAPIDGGTTTGRVLIDDVAADFSAGSPSLAETRIDPAGAVAPQAFYQGSLCAGGSNDLLFTDGHTGAWTNLPATPARPALARSTDLNLPDNGFPAGVGITAGSDWTLWWYGEVFITAGSHPLTFKADDHGFFELAAPGTSTFTTRLESNWDEATATATYTAPVTGWYPVRMAVAQRGGGVDLFPSIDGAPIPRRLTRCRVDTVAGLALTGFDEARFLDVGATTIVSDGTAANVDWGFGNPGDVGVTNGDTFAVRWSGQVFIEVAGTYRLRVQTDDGYRLWVDGAAAAADVTDGVKNDVTGDLVLARGWHDLVFDTTESTLGAKSILKVESGPDLVGQPFPATRLRPAEGRAQRFESITAGGTADLTADLGAAIVNGVDVGYALNVTGGATITTQLAHGPTTATLRNNSFTGDTVDRYEPTGFGNLTTSGPWSLAITAGNGTLTERWLTIRYRDPAGTGPTPLTSSYQSSVRDLLAPGGASVASLTSLSFDLRAATGATVSVAVRTCTSPGACASAPWSAEFASGAALTGVTARRYLQYRVTFATDGDHEPALERFQLDYLTQ